MITILLVAIVVILVAILSSTKKQTAFIERESVQQKFPAGEDVTPEIVQLARSGDRVGAIKAYRDLTGCSVELAQARINPLLASASPNFVPVVWIIAGLVIVGFVIAILAVR